MDFELSQEQKRLRERIRKFANDRIAPKAREWDYCYDTPQEAVRLLRDEGLFRLFYPSEYGGEGLSSVNICIVREELSKISYQADGIFTCGGMGSVPLVIIASEEQKKKYLPAFARGEKIIVFCLSEPGAGSDIGAIETTARLDGDHYLLNGTKSYVSYPEWTDYYCVFAKTNPTQRTKGLSALIVERGREGPTFKIRRTKMSYPLEIGDITFTDYIVPRENLLGKEGEGARVGLSLLDIFRTSVGASVLGFAQRAYNEAKKFAQERIVFKQPLMSYQVTQFKMAELATQIQAARLMVYMAAWKRDHQPQDEDTIKQASMAKLFATEVAYRVVNEAVQIFGGRGVTDGYIVELLYRLVRASTVYEGTSEIQKQTIARRLMAEDTLTSLP